MNLWYELKYTFRLLRKKLGFTALCVFVIALGLAIAFPLIVFTKFAGEGNLPFENGERFAIVMEDTQISSIIPTSQRLDPYVFEVIKERAKSFRDFGAYRNATVTVSDGEGAETFLAAFTTPNLIDMTGIVSLIGRNLRPEDDVPGATPVTVISYALWNAYYGGDENIVGRQSRINGQFYTVVGVMPEGFAYPYSNDLWLPLQLTPNPQPGGNKTVLAVGLLAEDSSFSLADAEVKSILQPLSEEFSEFYDDKSAVVMHYTKIFNSSVVPITGPLFMGLTITVLLLVSFNVGNLLIIRSNERLSELAVRGAVGGTRLLIVTQVMLESFLIAAAAVVLGLILGQLSMISLSIYFPEYFSEFPFWFTLDLQFTDGMAVVVSTMLIWLISGVYPAWQASRSDMGNVLCNGGSNNRPFSRFTRILVSLELIASCFLLILSLALVLGIYRANQVDLGVRTNDFLLGRVDLSSDAYSEAGRKLAFLDQLKEELSSLELFEGAAYTTAPPKLYAERTDFSLADQDLRVANRYPELGYVWTSDNYFEHIDAQITEGRDFDAGDNQNSLSVVVVDDAFAQRYWPGQSALGKRILFNANETPEELTIVGVINHIVQGNPIGAPLTESTFYRPLAQLSQADAVIQRAAAEIFLLADAPNLDNSPLNIYERALKQAGNRVDRDVSLLDVMVFSKLPSMQAFNLFASMMLGVSLATLVLAVVGIYGVVSRSIFSRIREISIRRALGSTNRNIMRIFVRQASGYLLSSFIVGGMAALLILAVIGGQLQSSGELNSNSWVVAVVFTSLGLLVFLASYMPVRKAVAIEPGEGLHYE